MFASRHLLVATFSLSPLRNFSTSIGFVGLGSIGRPVAVHFLETLSTQTNTNNTNSSTPTSPSPSPYTFLFHDINTDKKKLLSQELTSHFSSHPNLSPPRWQFAQTAQNLKHCDIVFSFLPSIASVRSFYLSDRKGFWIDNDKTPIAVDFSTIDFRTAREHQQRASSVGGLLVQAPIFGSVSDATRGTLRCYVGSQRGDLILSSSSSSSSSSTTNSSGESGETEAHKLVGKLLRVIASEVTFEGENVVAGLMRKLLQSYFVVLKFLAEKESVALQAKLFKNEAAAFPNDKRPPSATLAVGDLPMEASLLARDLAIMEQIAEQEEMSLPLLTETAARFRDYYHADTK